jgi:hypothetical protein
LIACLGGFVASRFLIGRVLHSVTNKKTDDALES